MEAELKTYRYGLIYPTEQVRILASGTDQLAAKSIAVEIYAATADGREVSPQSGASFSKVLQCYYAYLAPADSEGQGKYSFDVHYPEQIQAMELRFRPWQMDKSQPVSSVLTSVVVGESPTVGSNAMFGNFIALAVD